MYRTCLHCHAPLGANEVVEHFPVGRRLAFDSTKGRLWVVCDKCRRWNLTPVEERWEAIEECEREFSRTRLRASTDNIAIARIPAGLDLVRVGAPKFPELAAWRYGKSLHQRWKTRAVPVGILGMSGLVGQAARDPLEADSGEPARRLSRGEALGATSSPTVAASRASPHRKSR